MVAGKLPSAAILSQTRLLFFGQRNCFLDSAANSCVSRSRQAIKKYVKANNKITITSEAQFDSMFNKALKTGVEKGDFTQPKGMSDGLL